MMRIARITTSWVLVGLACPLAVAGALGMALFLIAEDIKRGGK